MGLYSLLFGTSKPSDAVTMAQLQEMSDALEAKFSGDPDALYSADTNGNKTFTAVVPHNAEPISAQNKDIRIFHDPINGHPVTEGVTLDLDKTGRAYSPVFESNNTAGQWHGSMPLDRNIA